MSLHAFDNNSKLYVSWSEISQYGSISQIRVKSYDNSTWSTIDGGSNNGINLRGSRNATHPSLADNGTHLFAIWSEDNGAGKGEIRSAVYDNATDSWDTNSNFQPLNYSTSYSANNPQLLYHNSSLYAIWSETNADNRTQIRVKSYDGSSWSFVDGNNATKGINKDYTQNASYPQLVKVTDNSSSSKLYAVWLEENGNTQVRVAEFDGTSSWNFKDGDSFDGLNLNTAKITGKPSAAAYLNKLIVAWSETNSLGVPQIRVAKSPF